MPVDPETVLAMNAAHARLALSEARAAELTIELDQLREAIENVSRKVEFAAEPADFRAALVAVAGDRP